MNQEFILIIDRNDKVRSKIEEVKNERENVCEFCDKNFSFKGNMMRHIKKFHSEKFKTFSCDRCDFKCLKKNFLINHWKLKHQEGKEIKFECDFDEKIFETKNKLYSHITYHHKALEKCKICEKEVKSLKDHMRAHPSNNKKIQCEICKKALKNQNYMKDHLKTHNKQHQCRVCGHKFALFHHLKEHLKVHENRFVFRCEKCQKNFTRKDSLRAHLKTHDTNRLKQHKCHLCEFSANPKTNLKIHLRTHDKNRKKNFKCSKCDFKTDFKASLKRHLEIHDPNRPKFLCLYCKHEAATREHLKTHLKRKHVKKDLVNHLNARHKNK